MRAIVATMACRTGASSQDAGEDATTRVVGARLVLAPNNPQLASLATAPVLETQRDSVRLPGRLVWNEDATVRVFSPFAGRVMRVVSDAGRRVKQGDTLALLAAPDFGQAQADARRASTDLALAERTAARARKLVQEGIAAQKDVESAQADVARAQAERQRAYARLAGYGADSVAIDQLFALRAPLNGTVVERAVTTGQEVRADQMLANAPQLFAPMFVVTDPARLWVMLDLPERDIPMVHAGSPIDVRAQAWPARGFPGHITLVASAVDPSTRTVKVRGSVLNAEDLLKAEMLVTVVVPVSAGAGVAVPATAVVLTEGGHVVFVDEGHGSLRRCQVDVSPEHDGVVDVKGGVAAKERVVTDGALLLEQLYRSKAHS